MNKTEQRYADEVLTLKKLAGEIRDFRFEAVKLRLADRTFYSPDFYIVAQDHIEIHEIKGFMEDDAAVKIKVAAQMYPEFAFVLVTHDKAGWHRKEV